MENSWEAKQLLASEDRLPHVVSRCEPPVCLEQAVNLHLSLGPDIKLPECVNTAGFLLLLQDIVTFPSLIISLQLEFAEEEISLRLKIRLC